jgi:regulator of replication initiation timing
MAETIKFTNEELESIQDIRDGFDRKVTEFGYIYLEHKNTRERLDAIAAEEERLNNEYQELLDREKELVTNLNEKYGTGTVDLTNGEFKPAE